MPCDPKKSRCSKKHCPECPKNAKRHLHGVEVYCSDHFCPVGPSPCSTPKKEEDKTCATHLKCQDRLCPNLARPQDQKLCPSHECSIAGCHKPRLPQKIHCSQHIAVFCIKHGCANPTAPPLKLCQFHILCAEGGCNLPRQEKPGGVFDPRCSSHIQRKCGECDRAANGTDIYCWLHACAHRACSNPVVHRPGAQFCLRHTCNTPNCDAPVSDLRDTQSRHCRQHACIEARCHNSAKVSGGGFCKEAHGCIKNECPLKRRPYDRETLYCADHQCAEPGCPQEARNPKGYCRPIHVCLQDDCPEKRSNTVDSSYCKSHECAFNGCPKVGGRQGGFCTAKHACAIINCPHQRESGNSRHCSRHRCDIASCTNPSRDNSRLCDALHACRVETCNKQRRDGTTYCARHCCQRSGCAGRSKGDGNGYCEAHACTTKECKNAPDHRETSCTAHLLEKAKAENIKLQEEAKQAQMKSEATSRDSDGAKGKQPEQAGQVHGTATAAPVPTVAAHAAQAAAHVSPVVSSGAFADGPIMILVPRTNSWFGRLLGLDKVTQEDGPVRGPIIRRLTGDLRDGKKDRVYAASKGAWS